MVVSVCVWRWERRKNKITTIKLYSKVSEGKIEPKKVSWATTIFPNIHRTYLFKSAASTIPCIHTNHRDCWQSIPTRAKFPPNAVQMKVREKFLAFLGKIKFETIQKMIINICVGMGNGRIARKSFSCYMLYVTSTNICFGFSGSLHCSIGA